MSDTASDVVGKTDGKGNELFELSKEDVGNDEKVVVDAIVEEADFSAPVSDIGGKTDGKGKEADISAAVSDIVDKTDDKGKEFAEINKENVSNDEEGDVDENEEETDASTEGKDEKVKKAYAAGVLTELCMKKSKKVGPKKKYGKKEGVFYGQIL